MFITENKDLDLSNLRLEGKGLFKRILPICIQIKGQNNSDSPYFITQNSFSHHDFFSEERSEFINTNLLLSSLKNVFTFTPDTIFQMYQFNQDFEIFDLTEIIYENDEQFQIAVFQYYLEIEKKTLINTFQNKDGFYNYFEQTFDAYLLILESVDSFKINELNINLDKEINTNKALLILKDLVDYIFSLEKSFKFYSMESFLYFSFCVSFFKNQRILFDFSVDLDNNSISINNIESLRKKINVI